MVISVLLNLPWTVLGMCLGLLSLPRQIRLHTRPLTIVLVGKSFWYIRWLRYYRGVRATTLGHCVVLGPAVLPNDFEHELIHIEQTNRAPFIYPILYFIEALKHSGKDNKYEREAYRRSSSTYLG